MTYIISIAFIFIASIATITLGGGSIGGTIDIPSMFVMLATIFTVLIAASSVRDFFRGLKIAVSKKEFSALQIAQSLNAVSLVIQSLLCACAMIGFLCLAMILSFWGDTGSWGVVIALGLLTLFYTGEILLILLPVKSLLSKKLSSCKKSPSQECFVFAKLPFKPFIAFAIGMVVLFFLLTLGHTFVLSDFSPQLISQIPLMLVFLLGSSYLFLVPAKLFVPFLNALKIGIKTKSSENLQSLSEARRALNFVIILRFALAFCGAVLVTVVSLNSLEDADMARFMFSVSLILVSLSFLSALLLLPIRARIEKAVNFRIYAGA